jgi:hypothetical protein
MSKLGHVELYHYDELIFTSSWLSICLDYSKVEGANS